MKISRLSKISIKLWNWLFIYIFVDTCHFIKFQEKWSAPNSDNYTKTFQKSFIFNEIQKLFSFSFVFYFSLSINTPVIIWLSGKNRKSLIFDIGHFWGNFWYNPKLQKKHSRNSFFIEASFVLITLLIKLL